MVKINKLNLKKLSIILLSSLTIITISGCTSNTKPYYENHHYIHGSLVKNNNKVKVINRKSRYYKI